MGLLLKPLKSAPMKINPVSSFFKILLLVVSLGFVSSCKNDVVSKKLEIEHGTVVDAEGNNYKTVTIGSQTWMAENLKVVKYNNGALISTNTSDTLDISAANAPKYQWAYGNDEANVATYGRLYTWFVVTDSRGICPTGWHVSTDADWKKLTEYIGGNDEAESKLKEEGSAHWSSPNDATNEAFFTALPGGYRSALTFKDMKDFGYWWSTTEYNDLSSYDRVMYFGNSTVFRYTNYKYYGFSVRCVKD